MLPVSIRLTPFVDPPPYPPPLAGEGREGAQPLAAQPFGLTLRFVLS
jgi:hypothetical protein